MGPAPRQIRGLMQRDGPDLRGKMLPAGCPHRPTRGPGLDPVRHARDRRAHRAPPERSRHVMVNPRIPWLWHTLDKRINKKSAQAQCPDMRVCCIRALSVFRSLMIARSMFPSTALAAQDDFTYPAGFASMDWLISQRLPSGSAKCAVRSPQGWLVGVRRNGTPLATNAS
jgi:hypothetical protein